MKSFDLQYYVDALKTDQSFSLARYGDGELYCMWGRKGRNSNGCAYLPALRQALLDSLRHHADPNFIYGLQRVLPQDRARVEIECPHIDWYDSEVFSEAVADGKLFPLIDQIRNMAGVMVVGNESIAAKTAEILDWDLFMEVPARDAFLCREEIIYRIMTNRPKLVLFSCGMAANALIAELHGKIDATLLDLGHIWDPFTGNMSRCDLEGKTEEDIMRNLKPQK